MTSLNYLEHKDNKSIFLIVAGANGSGKSTIYENFLKNLPEYANIKFINPDVIAKNLAQSTKNVKSINDLSPKEQAKINFEAGKEALKIRAEKLK
ncbi:MAG: zeta toxin family protein, partial [Succinivibrionaceae bacterium]|nr:zeta toxin family protein [Succinivibrionaceae bacterium]